jgi:hypothetical protein
MLNLQLFVILESFELELDYEGDASASGPCFSGIDSAGVEGVQHHSDGQYNLLEQTNLKGVDKNQLKVYFTV